MGNPAKYFCLKLILKLNGEWHQNLSEKTALPHDLPLDKPPHNNGQFLSSLHYVLTNNNKSLFNHRFSYGQYKYTLWKLFCLEFVGHWSIQVRDRKNQLARI